MGCGVVWGRETNDGMKVKSPGSRCDWNLAAPSEFARETAICRLVVNHVDLFVSREIKKETFGGNLT